MCISEKNIKNTLYIKKQIPWQDLRQLTKWQIICNVCMPYLFLLVAWVMFINSCFFFALLGWYAFFTSSFRQAHDAYHRTLGVNKKVANGILYVLSTLLLTSTHAVRETHLLHHRDPLSADDIETRYFKVTWYQAIIGGFSHWWSLQTQGLALASTNNQTKIKKDFILMLCMLSISIFVTLYGNTLLLFAHVMVVSLANLLVGFVAGWVVHRGCDNSNKAMTARTERNWLINRLTFNMWYHQEHHLFPAVPANNLPKLAKRLDAIAPELTTLRILK